MLNEDTYAANARIQSITEIEKRISLEDFDFSEPKNDVEDPSAIFTPNDSSIRAKKQRKTCSNVIFFFTTVLALSIGISLGFYANSRWGNKIFHSEALTEVDLPDEASNETPIEDVVMKWEDNHPLEDVDVHVSSEELYETLTEDVVQEVDIDIIKTECETEADCKERMIQGYGKFIAGNFPVMGCFSKDGDLYWGNLHMGDEVAMETNSTFFHEGVEVEEVLCLTHVAPTKAEDGTPLTDNDIAAYNDTMKDVNFIEAKCLTEADCEERMSEGYDKFEVGNFPLSGCFSKDGILYWGTGENFDQSMDLDAFFQSGDVEGVFCLTYETPNNEMDVMHGEADVAAIENTIKELDDEMDAMHGEVHPKLECLTEKDCEEQMSQGYEMFEVGDFPLSGCFAKDRILYWGTGETFDESMDLDAFFQGGGAVEGVFC
jgi:hypothetical protein